MTLNSQIASRLILSDLRDLKGRTLLY